MQDNLNHPPGTAAPDVFTPADVVPPHPDVVWRHANGSLYLLAPGRERIFRIEGLDLVAVNDDEVKSAFGDSSEAVIRISNQI